MAPVIFINIKNGTTIIHNITTLQMFPSKGDVLHIPYGFTDHARGKLVTPEEWF